MPSYECSEPSVETTNSVGRSARQTPLTPGPVLLCVARNTGVDQSRPRYLIAPNPVWKTRPIFEVCHNLV